MQNYYKLAELFCSKLEKINSFSLEDTKPLLLGLMDLFQAAVLLCYPEDVEDSESPKIDAQLHIDFGKYDMYWSFLNPYFSEDAVCGSLSDDINDIYHELMLGLALYRSGKYVDAIWQWKFGFENHWKYHAVDAIKALNSINQ